MRATWARVVVPLIAVVLVTSCSASGGRKSRPQLPPVRVNPDHVRTLTAVLDGMVTNYAKLAESSPGPQDILDYNVGALWRQGIDGTGTTIALIEGWDDPR